MGDTDVRRNCRRGSSTWRVEVIQILHYTHQRASKEGTNGKMNPSVMDRALVGQFRLHCRATNWAVIHHLRADQGTVKLNIIIQTPSQDLPYKTFKMLYEHMHLMQSHFKCHSHGSLLSRTRNLTARGNSRERLLRKRLGGGCKPLNYMTCIHWIFAVEKASAFYYV